MGLKRVVWLLVTLVTLALVIDQIWTNYLSTELFFKALLTMIIVIIAGVSISMVRTTPSEKKTDDGNSEKDKE